MSLAGQSREQAPMLLSRRMGYQAVCYLMPNLMAYRFERWKHAVDAHAPSVVSIHQPRAPALATAVPGEIPEGSGRAQLRDVVRSVAAAHFAAREQDPFGVHSGHYRSGRAGWSCFFRKPSEVDQA